MYVKIRMILEIILDFVQLIQILRISPRRQAFPTHSPSDSRWTSSMNNDHNMSRLFAGSYCCVARNCMGETSSLAELTIEDIQNQLNESEKLQLTSNTQPPRFLLGLKSTEANINESFVFMIKGRCHFLLL